MSSTTTLEHSYYIGNYMSGILYGVNLVMYFATLKCCRQFRKRDILPIVYSTALLIFLTMDIAANAYWGEQMWITSRNMPGGPSVFVTQDLSVWYQIVGSSAAVCLIFSGDSLLLYRCFILWGSNYKIIILPILVYLAAFSLAIVELVGAFTPGGYFYGGRALVFGTTYYALSISLNAIVTLLICGRLIYFSRLMTATLGNDRGSARFYTGIAAMIAESAAPYTLVGIVFLVLYARQSKVASLFGQLYAKLACLSPQLIVLRVAQGTSWERDTGREQTLSECQWRSPTERMSLPCTGTHLSILPSSETDVESSKLSRSSRGSLRKNDGIGDVEGS